MTTYLLDSNVCIAVMRGKKPHVTARLFAEKPTDLRVCSIVVAELTVGAIRSRSPATELQKVATFLAPYTRLGFGDVEARKYAEIRANLETRGELISDMDTLVTHNTAEFGRVPGLSLEDWETP